MQFRLELGDPSQDGHNMSEDVDIITTATMEEMVDAYQRMPKETPVDLNKMFADYEDNRITDLSIIFYLMQTGLTLYGDHFQTMLNKDATFNVDDHCEAVEIWIHMMKQMLPQHSFQIVPKKPAFPHSFGYGLFWS